MLPQILPRLSLAALALALAISPVWAQNTSGTGNGSGSVAAPGFAAPVRGHYGYYYTLPPFVYDRYGLLYFEPYGAFGPLFSPGFGNTMFGQNDIPRASDAINVQVNNNRQLVFVWQGEPRLVSRIGLQVLDKNRSPLKEQVIAQLPAEIRMTLPDKAVSYRLVIQYINGTTTQVMSPLPTPPETAAEKPAADKQDKTTVPPSGSGSDPSNKPTAAK